MLKKNKGHREKVEYTQYVNIQLFCVCFEESENQNLTYAKGIKILINLFSFSKSRNNFLMISLHKKFYRRYI